MQKLSLRSTNNDTVIPMKNKIVRKVAPNKDQPKIYCILNMFIMLILYWSAMTT